MLAPASGVDLVHPVHPATTDTVSTCKKNAHQSTINERPLKPEKNNQERFLVGVVVTFKQQLPLIEGPERGIIHLECCAWGLEMTRRHSLFEIFEYSPLAFLPRQTLRKATFWDRLFVIFAFGMHRKSKPRRSKTQYSQHETPHFVTRPVPPVPVKAPTKV
jgi:hypothetical protein